MIDEMAARFTAKQGQYLAFMELTVLDTKIEEHLDNVRVRITVPFWEG
jgi:hypothetical protein